MNKATQPTNNKQDKKKSHVPFLVILAVLLFLVLIVGSRPDDRVPRQQTPQPAASSKAATVAGLNQPVRDGKFEFTVTGLTCGQAKVGENEFLTKTAQGQFCLLNLTVKNIGRDPQLLSDSNQKLIDAQGRNFASDSSATLYANPTGSTFFQNINPGNSVTGVIVFDVPKDTQMKQAKLFDSAFSQGVVVNLQ